MEIPIPIQKGIFLDTTEGLEIREVNYFVDYYPYYKGRNPKFDEHSASILEFKKGNPPSTILLFAINIINQFDPEWNNCCCVAVPSSDSSKKSTPVHIMIKVLATLNSSLQDGSDVLVRTKTIRKLSWGGKRDISVHLDSIDINPNSSIDVSGKDVLLIDDVMTTGNSLLACESKLIAAGANRVFFLTLAKTV